AASPLSLVTSVSHCAIFHSSASVLRHAFSTGAYYSRLTQVSQSLQLLLQPGPQWFEAHRTNRRSPLMKRLLRFLTFSFFYLVVIPVTPAQTTVTGAFEGIVTNSLTGDPIEGAQAEITSVGTGITYTKLTDARGRFYQGQLQPGAYRIRVSIAGFQTREVNQRLQIASTGEVVPVPVSLDPLAAVAAPLPAPTPAATPMRASLNPPPAPPARPVPPTAATHP